jgi:hypothetical protein
MLELRGGILIGQEALQLSEPCHSPDKATPTYYTKNVSFASGIYKMCCVCANFHHEKKKAVRSVNAVEQS